MVALAALAPAAHAQSCVTAIPDPGIVPATGSTVTVNDSMDWDPDGAGPLPRRVIVAGSSMSVAGANATTAQWTGSSWQAASGVPTVMGTGLPWTVYDPDGDGPAQEQLVRAFTNTSSTSVGAWNGTNWPTLGYILGAGAISSLQVFDPDGPGPLLPRLMIGGTYTNAAGITPSVMQWDGTNLTSAWNLPSPPGVGVSAMTVWDQDGPGPLNGVLVAVGSFQVTNRNPNIAFYNGTTWSGLATTTPVLAGSVKVLTTWDPDGDGPLQPRLLLAGNFTIGGVQAYLATWDGQAWENLSGNFVGTIDQLVFFDADGTGPNLPEIFVHTTGSATIGGTSVPGAVARFDGTTWRSVLPSTFSGAIYKMRSADLDYDPSTPDEMLFMGSFTYSTGGTNFDGLIAHGVVRWDGQRFATFNELESGEVQTMTLFDFDGDGPQLPKVVVGGDMLAAGNLKNAGVACWDGSHWSQVGDGLVTRRALSSSHALLSLLAFDPDGTGPQTAQLYAGGYFKLQGGAAAIHVARLNGSAWEAVPLPPNRSGADQVEVQALRSWDPDGDGPGNPWLVVAFGAWTADQGTPVIAWDGETWHELGALPLAGTYNWLNDCRVWDPDGDGPQTPLLAVCGSFSGVSGRPGMLLWNGQTWNPMAGMDYFTSNGMGLTTFDFDMDGPATPELVCSFQATGGSALRSWNGSTLRSLPSLIQNIDIGPMDPDGSGPAGPVLLGGSLQSGTLNSWGQISWAMSRPGSTWVTFDPDGAGPQPYRMCAGSWNGGFWQGIPNATPITAHPTPRYACPGGGASFTVASTSVLFYQWRHNRVLLANGPGPGGSTIAGATSATLTISNAGPLDVGDYDCIVRTMCSSMISNPATLSLCLADLNIDLGTCDAAVTIDDLLYFLDHFTRGSTRADVDDGSGTGARDGAVTIDDLLYFLARYEAGC